MGKYLRERVILYTPCPTCKQKKGKSCLRKDGESLRIVHVEREKLYLEQEKQEKHEI